MPASDKNLFDQFTVLGIQTSTIRHSPMFTVEDGKKLLVHVRGGHCKTLFLKDKIYSIKNSVANFFSFFTLILGLEKLTPADVSELAS